MVTTSFCQEVFVMHKWFFRACPIKKVGCSTLNIIILWLWMGHTFLLACSHIMYGGYPTLRLYYASKTRPSSSFVCYIFKSTPYQIAWDELCRLSHDDDLSCKNRNECFTVRVARPCVLTKLGSKTCVKWRVLGRDTLCVSVVSGNSTNRWKWRALLKWQHQ